MTAQKLPKYIAAILFIIQPIYLLAQTNDSTLVIHKVQQGENLYRISIKYNTSIKKLVYWNHLPADSAIKINQQLKVWVPGKTVLKEVERAEKAKEPSNPENENIAQQPKTKPKVRDSSKTRQNEMYREFDTIKQLLKPVLSYVQSQNEPPEVFSGTRIALKEDEFDTSGTLQLSGYLDVYNSWYSESVGPDQFVQFPTLEPFANQVGLNQIALSAKYTASKMRSVVTLHYGDMPESSWSSRYNLIQQANAGLKIFKNVWFDLGYFRTHIGLESVQANENINSTIAVPTYFEPYFLSGAKLTYSPAGRFTFQINSFSGFNSFIETNGHKTIGFSVLYESDRLSVAYNNIISDDSSTTRKIERQRIYNNFLSVYKSQWFDLGFELNYALQGNTSLISSETYSQMSSGILAIKFKANEHFALYSRGEIMNDPNGIMSGIYVGHQDKTPSGLEIWGLSMGCEVKPIANSFLRLEGRMLQSFKSGQDIFYSHSNFISDREELVLSLGCWF